ncbi:MAG: DUF3048 domain-containing protein [Lachnospiraceae bacterium]|nr:DUF3048 domain-containing protein [Lachnospiraceae bacterium]
MRKRRIMKILLVLALGGILLAGCGKKEKKHVPLPTDPPSPSPTITPSPSPTPDPHEGMVQSTINGEWITPEQAEKRPFCATIGNIKEATPQQCGTSDADIIYECTMEGGITRLMGVFSDISGLKKLGSSRSARNYFVSLCREYDGIFVHFGQSKYAKTQMANMDDFDHLNGVEGIGETVFYRDSDYHAPHNAFTDEEHIMKGVEIKEFDTKVDPNMPKAKHFAFFEEDSEINGSDAASVSLKFSGYAKAYFIYNEADKQYYRFQYDAPHKDANTDKQLAFKNLIVQFVTESSMDEEDHQQIELDDVTDSGYYITNGKVEEITWSRDEETNDMQYFDSTGQLLTINPGKTYIALFPNDKKENITFNDHEGETIASGDE